MSARYEKSRLAAQKAYDQDNVACITNSNATDSLTQDSKPYQNDLRDATDLPSVPKKNRKPQPPAGRAELQAAGSRQQILDDKKYGGPSVLADEAYEEKEAKASLRKGPRNRATSTLSAKDSFKGLRDRVTGGSMHGRAGGIIGVDGSR